MPQERPQVRVKRLHRHDFRLWRYQSMLAQCREDLDDSGSNFTVDDGSCGRIGDRSRTGSENLLAADGHAIGTNIPDFPATGPVNCLQARVLDHQGQPVSSGRQSATRR